MIKTLFQITFVILLQILCSNAIAQARLGSTESQIRKDFSDRYFERGTANDGTKYIYWSDESMIVAYYLDSKNVCQSCAIFPKKQGTLNYLVEKYNKNYVIVSETQWKMYSDNGIMNIELVFDNGNAIIKFFN